MFETIVRKELPKIKKSGQKENSEQKAGWGKRFFLQAGCSGGSLQTFSLKFRGRCYRHRLESNYIQSSKRCYGICLQSSHQQPRNTWQLGKVGENCGFQVQTLHPLSFHPRPPPLQLQSGFGPRKIYLQTRPGLSLPYQNSCCPGLEGLTFHSDLEGWKVGGGSIPPEIVVTSQRPDLVILDKRKTQTQTHHPLRVANFVANLLLIPFLYKELGITSYIYSCMNNTYIIIIISIINHPSSTHLYDSRKNDDNTTMGEKYLISNASQTIILTYCVSIKRMGMRARWVKKYLIPKNMLTIISTILYVSLREEWGWGHDGWKIYLIPNNM